MTCLCPSCVEENWDECESTEWVEKWDIQVLHPIDNYRPPQALKIVEMDSFIDFDCFYDLVQSGNIYLYIFVISICNFITFTLVFFELMTTFCTFITAGHIFVVIAPEDNEEGTYYYLCGCVQAKQKLDHSIIDGEGLEYHIGAVVLTDTWLRRYSMKNPNLWLFED